MINDQRSIFIIIIIDLYFCYHWSIFIIIDLFLIIKINDNKDQW